MHQVLLKTFCRLLNILWGTDVPYNVLKQIKCLFYYNKHTTHLTKSFWYSCISKDVVVFKFLFLFSPNVCLRDGSKHDTRYLYCPHLHGKLLLCRWHVLMNMPQTFMQIHIKYHRLVVCRFAFQNISCFCGYCELHSIQEIRILESCVQWICVRVFMFGWLTITC